MSDILKLQIEWFVSQPWVGTSEPVKLLSRVRLFAVPWTAAYQAPQSMEFSRQEYRSGLPFPSPGDLPDAGIESRSPTLQADTLPFEPPGKPYKSIANIIEHLYTHHPASTISGS